MRHNRLFPGIVLIFIGLGFLLRTLGILHFHFANLLHLWPLFLVIGGVNLILSHNRAPWAMAVRVLVVVACLGVLLFGDFGYNNRWGHWRYTDGHRTYHLNDDNDNDDNDNDDDDDDDSGSKGQAIVSGSSVYSEPWDNAVKVATLNVSGGATTYTLSDTTNDLMNARTQEFNGKYVFNHHVDDSTAVIDLNMKGKDVFIGSPGKANSAVLKLNSKPVWDISIKGGADKLNFDLAKFKVRTLWLSGGATDYTVKMGMPLAETKVNISAGVSDITINVPSGAACDVTTSAGLSSDNINGFNKVSDNHYQTGDFNTATKRLYIHFSGGISDFKVNRY